MPKQWRVTFQVYRHGRLLDDYPLSSTLETGLDFTHLPGCLPVYYEVAACNAANYRYFDDWQQLKPEQQAFLIAYYLRHKQVENHTKDAEEKAVKAKMPRGRK